MPSKVIQQLLNILQAANVEAVKVDRNDRDCRPLLTSLFLANGATAEGDHIEDLPTIYVGDYLISYTTPGGEEALLTRAQAQVIMEFWDLEKQDEAAQGTEPLGCCTDRNGKQTENVKYSSCAIPPNRSWSQGPCGGYGDSGPKRGCPDDQAATK